MIFLQRANKTLHRAPAFGFMCAVPDKPKATDRCRAETFYSGRVQGVGFRYMTKSIATGFEIAGTVRNLSDGRVELIAEGNREELEAFLVAIRADMKHFVSNETVTWTEAQNNFKGFEIVR